MLGHGLLDLAHCYPPAPRMLLSIRQVLERGLLNGCTTILYQKPRRYSASCGLATVVLWGNSGSLHQSSALWLWSKTTFSEVLWPPGRPDKHTDKYIFLLAFVLLLSFLHHFLGLFQFCIHQLLLQFSVFKYFVQMLKEKKWHISSLITYWCWEM